MKRSNHPAAGTEPSGGGARSIRARLSRKAAHGGDSVGPVASDRVVDVYTDGACRGNPGPGGWGVILRYGEHERELRGGEPDTTNNRMELMAAIMALETLTRPSVVRLHTDSQYVRNGITGWVAKWKRNGWLTAGKEPVKNADLWRRLESAVQRHRVEWLWVRGHSGHPENERADALARLGCEEVTTPGGRR